MQKVERKLRKRANSLLSQKALIIFYFVFLLFRLMEVVLFNRMSFFESLDVLLLGNDGCVCTAHFIASLRQIAIHCLIQNCANSILTYMRA